MKGGYKIIDLKGVNLASVGTKVKIDGIYERLENNYGKPIMLTGIVVDEIEIQSQYIALYVSGSNYVGTIPDEPNLKITIEQDDNVHVDEIL